MLCLWQIWSKIRKYFCLAGARGGFPTKIVCNGVATYEAARVWTQEANKTSVRTSIIGLLSFRRFGHPKGVAVLLVWDSHCGDVSQNFVSNLSKVAHFVELYFLSLCFISEYLSFHNLQCYRIHFSKNCNTNTVSMVKVKWFAIFCNFSNFKNIRNI